MTTVVVACSDWHIGREDMPTYERAGQLSKRVLNHPMLPRKVDSFALAFIGDILDGIGIFPSQYAINNTTAIEQIALAKNVMRKTIADFAKKAETYVFLEPGNHGRISKYAHPDDNLERMMYHDIADEMGSVAKCYAPDSNDIAVVDVEKTVGVITHHGPPHIETQHQRGKALSDLYEYGADWLLCAHLHHIGITSQGFWYFRNGTLMNRGERHAAGLHLYDSPRQLCLTIDDDRVIGSFWVDF
jgi:hypothetical protein